MPKTRKQADFEINGMTCASCVGTITAVLESMPGVVMASANLLQSTGSVRYKPAVVHVRDLIDRIEDAGFEAKLLAVSLSFLLLL